MSVFLDADRRIRSGWVVAAFALVATAVELAGVGLAGLLDLFPDGRFALSDPLVATASLIHLTSALAATAVAWGLMGQEPGLARPPTVGLGALAGALLVTASIAGGALASGALGISTCSSKATEGLLQLLTLGPAAVAEELWMRGVALRALARGTHPAFAVAATGLVFGLLHLLNPEATFVAALNVALVGIWFGAMAWRAQSLWPAIGAHLAWNWFEGFVWGQPVSGIAPGCSLLTATSATPFFGGGAFGPEASGLTALLLAIAAALTVFWPKSARNSAGLPAIPP